MNIGGVIKKYRTKEHLTQEELAAALAVTPQAVSRWETGLSYPDIAMIPEIVKVLGVSADRLLGCELPDLLPDGHAGRYALVERERPDDAQDLPLNQDQIDGIFHDYVPQPEQRPKTVLVVDDSNFMRMMLSDILGKYDHTVLQAKTGEEGLDFLRKEKIDTCVLDIMMPGMNGLEALAQIRRDHPDLKVVMLSARCDETTVKKALELGADTFVAKPFQASVLVERI